MAQSIVVAVAARTSVLLSIGLVACGDSTGPRSVFEDSTWQLSLVNGQPLRVDGHTGSWGAAVLRFNSPNSFIETCTKDSQGLLASRLTRVGYSSSLHTNDSTAIFYADSPVTLVDTVAVQGPALILTYRGGIVRTGNPADTLTFQPLLVPPSGTVPAACSLAPPE